MRIRGWDELGIGIDNRGRYWGFTPCPESGDRARTSKAVQRHLRGGRWRAVLDLLARSQQGNRASRSELVTALGYAPAGGLSADDPEHREQFLQYARAQADDLTQLGRTVERQLTQALSDLSRKLRRLVQSEDDRPPLCIATDDPRAVESAFCVRYLLEDQGQYLHFGEPAT